MQLLVLLLLLFCVIIFAFIFVVFTFIIVNFVVVIVNYNAIFYDRAIHESAGPAFFALLADKYGYRIFPPSIEQYELDKIISSLQSAGEDTSLLLSYFQLDTNAQPAEYVLKPLEHTEKYKLDLDTIRNMLRRGAKAAFGNSKAVAKYFVSVTEQEVQRGIIENDKREEQTLILDRTLSHITNPLHAHRHLVDMIDLEGKPVIDEEAQKYLNELKRTKVSSCLNDRGIINTEYVENNEQALNDYVRNACDSVCEWLTKAILASYSSKFHVQTEPVVSEVLQHRTTAISKCSQFVGREVPLSKIANYLQQVASSPLAVCGESGTGKTALMAMAAKRSKEAHPRATVILRFLGTTGSSGSARSLLYSVCEQINFMYNRAKMTIPRSYKELISYFTQCLSLATADKPLILFLDSLDQMSEEDFGRNLKWLSLKQKLPSHVHVVVSTLPGQCLDILSNNLASENVLAIEKLQESESVEILARMLAARKRTLSQAQKNIVLEAFRACGLPLYMKLAVDIAIRWHSYSVVKSSDLSPLITGVIETIFLRLEHRYGITFVHHSLAYITAAKSGLSVVELEDILSCDDVVLDDVFVYWTPPFRRIPPLLWLRVRNELGDYLVERGVDGVNAYAWYHRQFWETAERRYLQRSPKGELFSFANTAHTAIADYFEGRWCQGKPYVPSKKEVDKNSTKPIVEDRQISAQPIVISGTRSTGRLLNKRKLRELPHSLIQLADWDRFEHIICTLDFIEAKFAAGQGFDAVAELTEAAVNSKRETIRRVTKFVGSNLASLLHEPAAVYQLASQQVAGHPLKIQFENYDHSKLPLFIVADKNPEVNEDPCEMTLRGHTSGIRCCRYSPSGDLIASTAEDGTLRLWHAGSGAELVTVSDLPGPTYPQLADPYHGERPCTFSNDGRLVATGSEDGGLQVWDISGTQVQNCCN